MDDSIADAYASKLSKQLGLSVSDSELEGFLKDQRQSADGEISEQTYGAVISEFYGWSPDEYRYVTASKLLRQKVAYEIDKSASTASDNVAIALKNDPNIAFKTLADNVSASSGIKLVPGASGLVPKTNQDGGLAAEAAKMTKNQVSGAIKSTIGDGYYFIRLLDINETQVDYEFIQVPLTQLTKDIENITNNKKINTYITI